MRKTKVVHCKRESYDVYIGRPSKWGNPFVVGKDGDRLQCVEKFRQYLGTRQDLLSEMSSLRGKVLGCWCSPKPCHGDIIAELLDGQHL